VVEFEGGEREKLVSGIVLSFGSCWGGGMMFEVEGTLGELKAVTE
jgi:hypothetical protein